MRRNWSVPTDDLGPGTKPHLRLSRVGLGAKLILPGNPVTWLVNPLSCFTSDTGSTDDASLYARENFSGSESTLGPGNSTTDPGKPAPRSTIGWGSRPGSPLATSATPAASGTITVSEPAGSYSSGSSLWRRVMGGR
jgi:hypothetical protein